METTGRWTAALAAVGALAALLLPRPIAAQEGGEVLRSALERYESRLEGVETVTITQVSETAVGGRDTSELRLVKRRVNGRALLVPRGDSVGSVATLSALYARLPELSEHAVLRGRATVDGHDAQVVHLAALGDVDLGFGSVSPGAADGGLRADSATLYVGTERRLVRRADAHGRLSFGGTGYPFTARARMSDFRDVEGFVYPYRSEVRISLGGVGRQMRMLLETMRQSARDSARRAMLDRVAAALDEEGIRVVSRVLEITVNGGEPAGGG